MKSIISFKVTLVKKNANDQQYVESKNVFDFKFI